MADVAVLIPGVVRSDGLTVSYTSDDYLEAFDCVIAMMMLSIHVTV